MTNVAKIDKIWKNRKQFEKRPKWPKIDNNISI